MIYSRKFPIIIWVLIRMSWCKILSNRGFPDVEGDVMEPQCRDTEETIVVQELHQRCLSVTLLYRNDNWSNHVRPCKSNISVPACTGDKLFWINIYTPLLQIAKHSKIKTVQPKVMQAFNKFPIHPQNVRRPNLDTISQCLHGKFLT